MSQNKVIEVDFDTSNDTKKLKKVNLDEDTEDKVPGFLVAYAAFPKVKDRFSFETPSYMIGRRSNLKFPVLDESLSRHHCRVANEDGEWWIEDLNSANGTYVSGMKVSGKQKISDGEIVRAGGSVLVFRYDIRPFLETLKDDLGCVGRFHNHALLKEMYRASIEDRPILLSGPSGAGKEVAAKAFHQICGRGDKAFIRYNMGRLSSAEEASSILFGVGGRVFSGVDAAAGLIEEAEGGVLLLDEIHNLPESVQRQLLRVIEDSELSRKGRTQTTKTDVVFIFTSNSPELYCSLANDLYNRLRRVEVPSLKQRAADIPTLFGYSLSKTLDRLNIDQKTVFNALNALHYEALCLFGFERDNVRGLFDFANKMSSLIAEGMPPTQAFSRVMNKAKKDPFMAENIDRQSDSSFDTRAETKRVQEMAIDTHNKYEANKDLILKAFEETEHNYSATMRELARNGIKTNRKTLMRHIKKWSSC